jgi:hypothetical protein
MAVMLGRQCSQGLGGSAAASSPTSFDEPAIGESGEQKGAGGVRTLGHSGAFDCRGVRRGISFVERIRFGSSTGGELKNVGLSEGSAMGASRRARGKEQAWKAPTRRGASSVRSARSAPCEGTLPSSTQAFTKPGNGVNVHLALLYLPFESLPVSFEEALKRREQHSPDISQTMREAWNLRQRMPARATPRPQGYEVKALVALLIEAL